MAGAEKKVTEMDCEAWRTLSLPNSHSYPSDCQFTSSITWLLVASTLIDSNLRLIMLLSTQAAGIVNNLTRVDGRVLFGRKFLLAEAPLIQQLN